MGRGCRQRLLKATTYHHRLVFLLALVEQQLLVDELARHISYHHVFIISNYVHRLERLRLISY